MLDNMDYLEAQNKALATKWKVGTCSSGEACWCRTIFPVDKITDDNGEEIFIAGQGEISKVFAEHIVKIHNESIK